MKDEEIERVNSAPFKADFKKYRQQVKDTKRPIILQEHNVDQVAVVPLEILHLAEKAGKKK